MKYSIGNLKKFLYSRGVTIEEFIKLIFSFGLLFIITAVFTYGAIAALLL